MAKEKKITVKHVVKGNRNDNSQKNLILSPNTFNRYLQLYPSQLDVPRLFVRLRYDKIQADINSFYYDFLVSKLPKNKNEYIDFDEKNWSRKPQIKEEFLESAKDEEKNAIRLIIKYYLDKEINIINRKPSKFIEYNIHTIGQIVDRRLCKELTGEVDSLLESHTLFKFLTEDISFFDLFTFFKSISKEGKFSTKFYRDYLTKYECFYSFLKERDELNQIRVFEWKQTIDHSDFSKKLNKAFGVEDSETISYFIEQSIAAEEKDLEQIMA